MQNQAPARGALSQWLTQASSSSEMLQHMRHAVYQKLIEAPHPGCSLGAGHYRRLPGIDQHPRLTEGKEDIYLCGQKTCEKDVIPCYIMQYKPHVDARSKHSEALVSGLGMMGTPSSSPPPESRFRRQPKAGLVNRPFIQEVSGLLACLFCTDGLFIRQGWCNW